MIPLRRGIPVLLLLSILFTIFPFRFVSAKPRYPLILIHGIYGSAHQWRGLCKDLEKHFGWRTSPAAQICVNASRTSTLWRDDVRFPQRFREELDPESDLFPVNFFNWVDEDSVWHLYRLHIPGWSQGNASAPVKQGAALGLLIREVLQRTGAEKVILVGHSLGGLAAREYLQRRDSTGNHSWWFDSTHHVDQLITLGTPHLGSNTAAVNAPFPLDEAIRDLRYAEKFFGGWGPDSARDRGVYLFGGRENEITFRYYNLDVDCNGLSGESRLLAGINAWDHGVPVDNPLLPLPRDIRYTWVVSRLWGPSDMVVRADRQALPRLGTIVHSHRNHTWFYRQTRDLRSLMVALDYPDHPDDAWTPETETWYEETCVRDLEEPDPVDWDWIRLPGDCRLLELEPGNAPLDSLVLLTGGERRAWEIPDQPFWELLITGATGNVRAGFRGHEMLNNARRPYRFRCRSN